MFISSIVLYSLEEKSKQKVDPVIERLEQLCKLWGKIKYTHPYILSKDIYWDKALIDTYPKIKASRTTEEFHQAIKEMLGQLKDPVTDFLPKSPPREKPAIPKRFKQKPQPFIEWLDKDTALIVFNDYEEIENRDSEEWLIKLDEVFREAQIAKKIIMDFRNLSKGYLWGFRYFLMQKFPLLLNQDISCPSETYITHNGFHDQVLNYRVYRSGLKTVSGGLFRQGKSTNLPSSKLCFLINQDSMNLTDFITALQKSKIGYMIFQGKFSPLMGRNYTRYLFSASPRKYITIRHLEYRLDGNEFHLNPDIIVKDQADPIEAAVHLMKGEIKPKPRQYTKCLPIKGYFDPSYAEMTYPTEPYRILALFRIWNIFDTFFPYKDLMDQKWESTLREFIPKFITISSETDYIRTIAQLAARTQDSHVKVRGNLWEKFLGTHRPPIRVDYIEKQIVITDIENNNLKSKLKIGDIIIKINEKGVENRRDELREVLPASTPGRLENRVDMRLLLGKENTYARLTVRKRSGKIKKVKVKRTVKGYSERVKPRSTPIFDVLPCGYGYIDFDRLLESQVKRAYEKIKHTLGLIIDFRGYPDSGALWFIYTHLLEYKVKTAKVTYLQSEYGTPLRKLFDIQQPSGYKGEKYKNPIVVLVNSGAQSAAEHNCLTLENLSSINFVGNPTSGANGVVSHMILPGNITVQFTGMGIEHADGRQLQRRGIQPNVLVYPTIQGIREGKDEILMKGIEVLKKMIEDNKSHKQNGE
jgi:C-terminal processing protease CtpA/Prc